MRRDYGSAVSPANNSMQRRALRAAADAERGADMTTPRRQR
jgi:hypothetical protein